MIFDGWTLLLVLAFGALLTPIVESAIVLAAAAVLAVARIAWFGLIETARMTLDAPRLAWRRVR